MASNSPSSARLALERAAEAQRASPAMFQALTEKDQKLLLGIWPSQPSKALLDSAVVERVLQRVAVFCGSSAGTSPNLCRYSYETGRGLADRGIGLVYGAGGFGLMRDVSQGALDAGGEVIGVMPRSMLVREWGRDDLTELHVVETMHERKAVMAKHADAFLCLPGGLGTLDEIMEVWSWRQIGFNDDPVGFLNVDGFWTPLLGALDGLVDAGFVRREVMDDLVVADNLDDALIGLANRAGATLPQSRESR